MTKPPKVVPLRPPLDAPIEETWQEPDMPEWHDQPPERPRESAEAFARRLERDAAESYRAKQQPNPPAPGPGPGPGAKRKKREATESNVWDTLQTDPELHEGELFKLDTFSGKTMLMHPIPVGQAVPKDWTPIEVTDIVVYHMMVWLQQHSFVKVSMLRVSHAIDMEAARNSFSSAREWLLGLEPWDGVVRLDHFFDEVCGAAEADEADDEDSIYRSAVYLAAIGRAFFISIVARVMQPGCQVDTVVVLESAEGLSKTNLLRTLAVRKEWFSDSMPGNLKDKDAMQHLPGKLIIELSELDQLKGTRNFSAIKNFLGRMFDIYRRSYGHREIDQPRQCVFVGTTNDKSYMPEEGGTRRFWPVSCTAIDLAKTKEWLPQLYAEALAAFLDGEPWHLDRELEQIAKGMRTKREVGDVWEAPIDTVIRPAEAYAIANGNRRVFVTIRECLEAIDPELLKSDRRSAEMRVAKILTTLGFKGGVFWENSRAVRKWWREVVGLHPTP